MAGLDPSIGTKGLIAAAQAAAAAREKKRRAATSASLHASTEGYHRKAVEGAADELVDKQSAQANLAAAALTEAKRAAAAAR